jgi:hypothetical protein
MAAPRQYLRSMTLAPREIISWSGTSITSLQARPPSTFYGIRHIIMVAVVSYKIEVTTAALAAGT